MGHHRIGHHRIGHHRIGHHRIGHHRIGHHRIGHHRIGHHRIGQRLAVASLLVGACANDGGELATEMSSEIATGSGTGLGQGGQTDGSQTGGAQTDGVQTDGSPTDGSQTGETGAGLPDVGDEVLTGCNLFEQDCPEGYKCMPWDSEGTGFPNTTQCTAIVPSPDQPGDECIVESIGVDTCDIGAFCLNSAAPFSPGPGTCVAMCSGSPDEPVCDDPGEQCIIDSNGLLNFCLPYCDPLVQDCPQGEGCYLNQNTGLWACGPDLSEDLGMYGDPCSHPIACDPGLVCLDASATPDCQGPNCCTEICDVIDPNGDEQCSGIAGGQQCLPWFVPGQAPPGFENVGVCAIPG